MLLRHVLRKQLHIIILLFLLFQLLPGDNGNNNECLISHKENPVVVIFLKNDVQMDSALITKESREFSSQSTYSEFYIDFIENVYNTYVVESTVSGVRLPIDYRKEIKQTIPHYFHGSKYKRDSLFI